MTIDVAVRPLVELGAFPLGGRRVVTFDGGTFEGRDGLGGTIAEGGVDWQLARPDGTLEIDAHYLLVTHDGASIEVRSTGLRKATAAVADRMARGEAVDPSEYYFRTHIRLSTSAPELAWMNDLLAVSSGERAGGRRADPCARSPLSVGHADPSVIVVGAGIGGLATALSLHEIGVAAEVFDSVREVLPLGVGINLLPHAVRELDALGLLDALRVPGGRALQPHVLLAPRPGDLA